MFSAPARGTYAEDSNNNSESSIITEIETISINNEVDIYDDQNENVCDCGSIAKTFEKPTEVPYFGNISVANSSDVHFGNKTVYQGPVTIKQFVYGNGTNALPNNNISNGDNSDKISNVIKDDNTKNKDTGKDNLSFCDENGDNKLNSFEKSKNATANNVIVKDSILIEALKKKKKVIFLALSCLLILVLSLTITMITLLKSKSAADEVPKTNNKEIYVEDTNKVKPLDFNDTNMTLTSKLRIIARSEWLAQPPIQTLASLVTPVSLVIIAHTATDNCTSQAECVLRVRLVQMFHIESRGWSDIGYNFLVGGDGSAYVGRGWTFEGAHTYGYNSKSIGIAFIGTFITSKPPQRQIDACKKLIQQGVQLGYISKDYKVVATRQLQATESPGAALYEDIKTWPHWSATP